MKAEHAFSADVGTGRPDAEDYARFMDDENFLSHRGMLERDHRDRKKPFWTLAVPARD